MSGLASGDREVHLVIDPDYEPPPEAARAIFEMIREVAAAKGIEL